MFMGSLGVSVVLLLVAAITPGPNNLLMLRIGLESGLRAALLPATGVVLGGVTMLLGIHAGVAGVIATHARLRSGAVIGGALFVASLGVRLIRDSLANARRRPETGLKAKAAEGILGMLLLQFVNPKSWLLVLTITATAAGRDAPALSLTTLVLLFIVIPYGCLALWAGGGSLAAGWLRDVRARAWFDRATGIMLVVSAGLLMAQR